MPPFPDEIEQLIAATGIAALSPAYLSVAADGQLADAGGALEHFGLAGLQLGQSVAAQVSFLEGLIPCPEPQLHLPLVRTETGATVDLHFLRGDGCDRILVLDSSSTERVRQRLQQEANEASLLEEKRQKRN